MPQKTLGRGDRREQRSPPATALRQAAWRAACHPFTQPVGPRYLRPPGRCVPGCRYCVPSPVTVGPPPSASPGSPAEGAFFSRFELDIQHGSCPTRSQRKSCSSPSIPTMTATHASPKRSGASDAPSGYTEGIRNSERCGSRWLTPTDESPRAAALTPASASMNYGRRCGILDARSGCVAAATSSTRKMLRRTSTFGVTDVQIRDHALLEQRRRGSCRRGPRVARVHGAGSRSGERVGEHQGCEAVLDRQGAGVGATRLGAPGRALDARLTRLMQRHVTYPASRGTIEPSRPF